MKLELLIDAMTRDWYGYGTWPAPYWFIGMEPGGAETAANAIAWDRLGRGELIDCLEHHLRAGSDQWHRKLANIQDTWGPLIRVLLIVKGRQYSNSSVLMYQQDAWGLARGETVVAELSVSSAPNLGEDVDRTRYRAHRIKTLRDRLKAFQPTFALFYGTTYQPVWEAITGVSFEPDGFTRIGRTIVAMSLHPTSRPTPGLRYWVTFARELKRRIDAQT